MINTTINDKIIYAIILCFLSSACTRKSNLELLPEYKQIDKIESLADCFSPSGNYKTEISSEKGGQVLFTQKFNSQSNAFYAKIRKDNLGFVVDSIGNVIDTLGPNSVFMVKSHDFHRLHVQPEAFFKNISFVENINGLAKYSATDELNRSSSIYLDKSKSSIQKIELTNSMDTTQTIEIIYDTWQESEYGRLAKSLRIIQAGRDTFSFDYQKIEINGNEI